MLVHFVYLDTVWSEYGQSVSLTNESSGTRAQCCGDLRRLESDNTENEIMNPSSSAPLASCDVPVKQ